MRHNIFKTWAVAMMALGAFAACDPIEDSYDFDTSEVSADQLQISATAKVVNGKNSNEIVVENHSPIPSEWTISQLGAEDKTSSKSCDVLCATKVGTNEVKFRGYNALSDTYVEKTLQVQVDAITEVPDYLAERLCIGTEGAPDHFGSTFDESLIEISTEQNIVKVRNGNPVLTDWICGSTTLDKNVGEMKMPGTGEYPISVTVTLDDGTTKTIDLGTVTVKDYDLPQIVLNLVGEHGEKTWFFAGEKYYGVGGYQEAVNQWALDAALGSFTSYFGMTGEETGSMTLNVRGEMTITPTGRAGTFSYDFPDEHGWHVGTLSCSIPILGGIAFDITAQQPSYTPTEYFIVSCDADELVLGAPCAAGDDLHDWTMCTFWVFKAGAESPMAGKPQVVKNLLGKEGTKTWKFAGEKYYGVGGYQEAVNQWPIDAMLGSFTSYFGMAGEEAGTMTLSVDGKMSISPTDREGTFSYDFPDDHPWHIGTLSCSIPILGGIAFDINAQQPSYTPKEYFIVSCEPNKLVLGAPCAAGDDLHDWTMCTFWVFEPAE